MTLNQDLALPINQLIERDLDSADVHLVTSEPGIGRNYHLTKTLEQSGKNTVTLMGSGGFTLFTASANADQLERAEVIVIDEFSILSDDQLELMMELMVDREIRNVPVKFKPSITITLRDDVVFIVSDRSSNRDEVTSTLKAFLGEDGRSLSVLAL